DLAAEPHEQESDAHALRDRERRVDLLEPLARRAVLVPLEARERVEAPLERGVRRTGVEVAPEIAEQADARAARRAARLLDRLDAREDLRDLRIAQADVRLQTRAEQSLR